MPQNRSARFLGPSSRWFLLTANNRFAMSADIEQIAFYAPVGNRTAALIVKFDDSGQAFIKHIIMPKGKELQVSEQETATPEKEQGFSSANISRCRQLILRLHIHKPEYNSFYISAPKTGAVFILRYSFQSGCKKSREYGSFSVCVWSGLPAVSPRPKPEGRGFCSRRRRWVSPTIVDNCSVKPSAADFNPSQRPVLQSS